MGPAAGDLTLTPSMSLNWPVFLVHARIRQGRQMPKSRMASSADACE